LYALSEPSFIIHLQYELTTDAAVVRRVMELASADGLPIYLESTMEAAGIYAKLGFASVDGFKMTIPGRKKKSDRDDGEDSVPVAHVVYEEVCMLWARGPNHPGAGRAR